MQRIIKMLILLILSTTFLFQYTEQSHFRGGSITARPLGFNATDVTVDLTLTFSWRSSFQVPGFYCDQTTVDNNQLTGPSTDYLVCKKIGTTLCSNSITSCNTYCQSFSLPTADDWTYGKKTVTVTLPQVMYYEASYRNNAWMKLNGGGSEGFWEVRIRMDTRPRSDNGQINTTPISTIPPIVKFRRGVKLTIPITWADADYTDDVRCRWATLANEECGGVCQDNPVPASNQYGTAMTKTVPPATLNETSCMLTFDGTLSTAIAPGFYAVALQIEDFMTKTDTVPLSSIPLQFLIELVSITSSCVTPPLFIGDRQQNGCYGAPVGSLYTDRMIVQPQCSGATIQSIQVLGINGGQISALYQMSGTNDQWAVNISWTPTNSQYGPNVVCGYATDSTYLIAFNCYTIVVGVAPPSLSVTQIKSPIGNLIRSQVVQSNGNIQWSLEFDQQIVKSKQSNYIKFYLSSNDSLMFKVDASGPDVSVNTKTLIFTTPSSHFDQGGSYYILLDYGVASGTLFCNPSSDKIDDKTFWTFSIDGIPTTVSISTSTTSKKSSEESNMGAIIGGVVGGLAGVGAVAGGIFLVFRLLKRKTTPKISDLSSLISESPFPSTHSPTLAPTPTPEQLPKLTKTRMAGFHVKDKNFNLNIKNRPAGASTLTPEVKEIPEIPLRPPPKNKMMGPLIKNKNFNLPLEDGIKEIINQNKNNFH